MTLRSLVIHSQTNNAEGITITSQVYSIIFQRFYETLFSFLPLTECLDYSRNQLCCFSNLSANQMVMQAPLVFLTEPLICQAVCDNNGTHLAEIILNSLYYIILFLRQQFI